MARVTEDVGGPKVRKTPATRSIDQIQAERLQKEAATLVSQAKAGAATLAAQLGAQVDPNTGKIVPGTMDPTKVTQWYETQPKPVVVNPNVNQNVGGKTVVSTYTDPTTGDVYLVYSDGSRVLQAKGTKIADAELAAKQAAAAEAEAKRKAGQSAYDLLFSEFDRYGLGSLVDPLKSFIVEGLSPAEFTLRLRQTDAYKKRFAANAQRINQGLRALSEAEYIVLEDRYQDVMKRYGLPESYYKRGDLGRQEGFEKFIAGDVSAPELEDRIQTAYNRVINAAPEVAQTLRSFYPEISDGDILAYALDPSKAIENIKRKVTAAEIGGAATQAGLATGLSRAEELQRYGVTGESARQGFQTIAGYLPRATTLGDIYAKQGMGPFTQTTAEAEVFGTPGAVEAAAKRRKLSELEQAQFGGSAGVSGGALARERAGQF